mgnify:CR=1 FL=1
MKGKFIVLDDIEGLESVLEELPVEPLFKELKNHEEIIPEEVEYSVTKLPGNDKSYDITPQNHSINSYTIEGRVLVTKASGNYIEIRFSGRNFRIYYKKVGNTYEIPEE